MLAPNPIPQPWHPVTRRVVRRPGYVLRYDGRRRGPSPAMRAAIAAFEDRGRRWVQGRRDTLFETGSTEQPARDLHLDIALAPHAVRSPTGAFL